MAGIERAWSRSPRISTKPLLIVVAAAMIVVSGLAAWMLLRDGGKHASAAEVVQRAAEARVSLADQIAPGTTFHMVTHDYDPDTPTSGSFAYPVHATLDEYILFGADGKVTSLRTIGTDDDTGEVFATTELVNGQLVDTDVRTGETFREPGTSSNLTASDFSNRLSSAESEAGSIVDGTKAARTSAVAGIDTYVIERADANGHVTHRSYIDKSTYREVKWENVGADGTVTKAEEIAVIESLDGAVLPTPAAVVATAIAGAQIVAGAGAPN